jgi:hypothetical protein
MRGGPLSTIQKWAAHLVAQLFYICLCKLLALVELLDPSVDFKFHGEGSVQISV